MKNSSYSEKQLQIINGEIPLETVGTKTTIALYKKAVANNDEELAQRLKERIEQSKEEAIINNRERSRISFQNRKKGIFEWTQPKTNEYTEHHKQIIRGEIHYNNVHSNELVTIHMIAKNNGDYELAERFLDLIKDRRESYFESRTINRQREKKVARINDKLAQGFIPEDKRYLTPLEFAMVSGEADFGLFTKDDIETIIIKAEAHNDEQIAKTARRILTYIKNPSELYITQDHREAIDMLEEQLQLPIRRPESWFTE